MIGTGPTTADAGVLAALDGTRVTEGDANGDFGWTSR